MRALCGDGAGGLTDTADLETAATACRDDGRFTWLEVDVGTRKGEAAQVAERFGLDPLAVEDAMSTRQRPKLETYERHRFLVVFQLDEIKDQLEDRQIAVFAGDTYILLLEVLHAEEAARRRRMDDDDRTDLLFRDVHDHVLRLGAEVRNIDDLASAVIDLIRGLQGDMLNDVNKKLSAWAAIIAIPTLIASIYGTNYPLWPPPDESRYWGFVGVVVIMLLCGGGLWLFFKRKRWI